jgi:hypothetical protein
MTFHRALSVMFLWMAASAAAAAPNELKTYRWRERVVLVFARNASDPRLLAQRLAVQTLTRATDDRDLLLVEVVGPWAAPVQFDAAALRRRFHVPPAAFRVLLIGKDGVVKLDQRSVLTAAHLVETIDAMPMRQEELRRR